MSECQSSNGGTDEAGVNGIFEQCVYELEQNGYALLPLSPLLRHSKGTKFTIPQAFETARHALDAVSQNKGAAPHIDPSSDSGSWTGYHNAAAVNGRYNEYREGFVFSNGEIFDVDIANYENEAADNFNDFRQEMSDLFRVMHDDVANGILRAIEQRLELPNFYFHKELGPTSDSSQWHMKRYVVDIQCNTSLNIDTNEECGNGNTLDPNQSQKEADIFLPVHTDPSLISVVILDKAGTNEGGKGLEVYHPSSNTQTNSSGTWKEITHHGHDVAIIFVGSVLSYLTKGQIFTAAKHRVVNWVSSCTDFGENEVINENRYGDARVAATLFVRPNGNAIMKSLPSPHLQMEDVSKKKPPTFCVWNARVAKNYMKKKQQQRDNGKQV